MDTTIIAVLSIFIFGLIHFLFFIVRKEILWLRIAFLSVGNFKNFYTTIYSTFIYYALLHTHNSIHIFLQITGTCK